MKETNNEERKKEINFETNKEPKQARKKETNNEINK